MENDIEKLEQDSLIQIPKLLDFNDINYTNKNSRACISGCQTNCEYSGQCDSCQNICQNVCEHGAQCTCQSVCQTNCQYVCQTYCEYECQTNCELSCQYACEDTCEVGCQVSCQSACEISDQSPKDRATIRITNVGSDRATIRITKNDATQIHVVVREMYGSQTIVFDTGTISISQSTATHIITGLTPNTTYAYNLWDDISGWVGLKTFTTESARPDDWYWTTSFYSGKHLPVQSDKTYIILPASEWKSFQNRINEFRDYTGFPQFGFTNVSRGTHFTDKLWNEAVYAICNMTSTSHISNFEASSRNRINASLFQSLADELNSIP